MEGMQYTGVGSGPRQCFCCGQRIDNPCRSNGTGGNLTAIYWCSNCGALEVLDYAHGQIIETYQRSLATKEERYDTVEKRAAYIYPKIIKAINNSTRRRIIVFLKGNKELSFTELKAALGGAQNASLSRHLNILQRSWLIERRVDLGSPRIAKDPYYSFYLLSEFGRSFLSYFSDAITQSVDLSPYVMGGPAE